MVSWVHESHFAVDSDLVEEDAQDDFSVLRDDTRIQLQEWTIRFDQSETSVMIFK